MNELLAIVVVVVLFAAAFGLIQVIVRLDPTDGAVEERR